MPAGFGFDLTAFLSACTALLAAFVFGGLIGLERQIRQRNAGLRTMVLVAVGAAAFVHLGNRLLGAEGETRIIAYVVSGIGFLGAGVIFKEGLSVRGLTTAASIWITAAIGIMIGIGFYYPAVLVTALTLGILSLFRQIENWMPSQVYAHHALRFERDHALPEEDVRKIMKEHRFNVANMSYRVTDDGLYFEYRMILRTYDPRHIAALSAYLRGLAQVKSFQLSPTGD